MKRIIILLVLLLAACSPAFAQAKNKMTDKGKSAAAMKSADSMADTLAAKERAIIDSITKKNQKAFLSLVSSDGVLSGPRGARRVGDLLTNIFDPDYTLNSATVEDPKVMMIDKDAAVLTYKSTGTETYKGKSETSTAYAVTVWARRGDTWMAVFHQESMVTPADAAQ